MEIILFLSGLICGGLISWGITHAYDKKSSKERDALFNKLSEELREVILGDEREKLSVLELNELIREKTIDEEVGEAIPYYKACPKCGSEDLEKTSEAIVDGDREGISLAGYVDFVHCKKCGWEKNLSLGEEYSRGDI